MNLHCCSIIRTKGITRDKYHGITKVILLGLFVSFYENMQKNSPANYIDLDRQESITFTKNGENALRSIFYLTTNMQKIFSSLII